MLELQTFMREYQRVVQPAFGGRVQFIGLQGSRARGESTPESDIDVVLILDVVAFADLERYRRAVAPLPHRELLCGFVSGVAELAGWSRPDLFQFYYDTVPYYGSLDTIIDRPTAEDARNAVLAGACNLYHGCAHGFLHTHTVACLRELYKAAVFVLQAKHCAQTGVYLRTRAALAEALTGRDLQVLRTATEIRTAPEAPEVLKQAAALLLSWSSTLIAQFQA